MSRQEDEEEVEADPNDCPSTMSGSTPHANPLQKSPTDVDHTEELRSCARELEQLAGRLEAVGAYQNADQVRRQATELWTTARP